MVDEMHGQDQRGRGLALADPFEDFGGGLQPDTMTADFRRDRQTEQAGFRQGSKFARGNFAAAVEIGRRLGEAPRQIRGHRNRIERLRERLSSTSLQGHVPCRRAGVFPSSAAISARVSGIRRAP